MGTVRWRALDDAPENFRRKQPRYAAPVPRVYANEVIEVTWEPKFCIHAAECLDRSPRVFEPLRRPWIDVDYDEPDHLADVIAHCPSGALHFRRLDGGAQERIPDRTTVETVPNGPLLVRGDLKITGPDDEVIREDTRVALCRCGSSANKPFCDGTHQLVGFKTTRLRDDADSRADPLES